MAISLADYPNIEWAITYTVLVGLVLVASLLLFINSLFTVRTKGDTARRGFIWLKLALLLTCLGTMFAVLSDVIIYVLTFQTVAYLEPEMVYTYMEIFNRFSGVASVFVRSSAVFALLTLVDVGLGILYCWDIIPKTISVVQWAAYGFACMESAITIIVFARFQAYYTAYYGPGHGSMDPLPFYKLDAAFSILLWIAMLAVTAGAIFIFVASRKKPDHRQASTLLLVACIFSFIELLWVLIVDAIWVIPQHGSSGTWGGILAAIFGVWFQFIALVLIFVVGYKKHGGLWSTEQLDFASETQSYGYDEQPMENTLPVYNSQVEPRK